MSVTRLRRTETMSSPASGIPAPQWRNLFLAPDWGPDEQTVTEEAQGRSEHFAAARRPRGGRRSGRRTA
ncbi:hypothetical protein GCM10023323_21980 [Streptomyces thinghirensis]|uniref:Uncharacterized protein n=1 Tax=Streptomyces thinghirensis TaxID=551547 RepID=A0ABP9T3G2_9ACTN